MLPLQRACGNPIFMGDFAFTRRAKYHDLHCNASTDRRGRMHKGASPCMPGESAQKIIPQFDYFLFGGNAQIGCNCCYSVAWGI